MEQVSRRRAGEGGAGAPARGEPRFSGSSAPHGRPGPGEVAWVATVPRGRACPGYASCSRKYRTQPTFQSGHRGAQEADCAARLPQACQGKRHRAATPKNHGGRTLRGRTFSQVNTSGRSLRPKWPYAAVWM